MIKNIPSNALQSLQKDGFYIDENLVDPALLQQLVNEISEWKNVPAVNGYGCIYHSGDALLQNLQLYSSTALKLALGEELLDFVETHFGERVYLSKCEYRRALLPKQEMGLHSDGSKDILVFIYLNGVEPETGMTAVVPGTHKIGTSLNGGSPSIPKQVQNDFGSEGEQVQVKGKPGTCLFFEADIWHRRVESTRGGREILWLTYSPISEPSTCLDMVFSRSSLLGLSDRQIDSLGLRVPELGNVKGEDFRMSRQLDPTRLMFLSVSDLLRGIWNNLKVRLRQSLPSGLKDFSKLLLRRGQPDNSKAKKISS